MFGKDREWMLFTSISTDNQNLPTIAAIATSIKIFVTFLSGNDA